LLIPFFADPNIEFAKLPEKIRSRVIRISPIATGCWIYNGARSYHGRPGEEGYARIWWDGRNWLGHRLTYTLLVGEIGPGLVLDHVKARCRRRPCIRPDHCEPVTMEVNTRRGDGYHLFTPKADAEEIPF